MGNEPNICCDNSKIEVNWFEEQQSRINTAKIGHDGYGKNERRGNAYESTVKAVQSKQQQVESKTTTKSVLSVDNRERKQKIWKKSSNQQDKSYIQDDLSILEEKPNLPQSNVIQKEMQKQEQPIIAKPNPQNKKSKQPTYDFQFVVNYRY